MTYVILFVVLVLVVANVMQRRRLNRYASRRREAGQRIFVMLSNSREKHMQWLNRKYAERRLEAGRAKAMESLKS